MFIRKMLDFTLKTAGTLLSPPGHRARLSILIYHRVLRKTDPLFPFEVDAQRFEAQMKTLRSLFNILPLSEAVFRIKHGSLPARSACVTFDDGYADNAEVALPILQRLHIPATFFIAHGFLDGGIMFNDRVIEIIRNFSQPMLDLGPLGLEPLPMTSFEQKRTAISTILSQLKYASLEKREGLVVDIERIASITPDVSLMMRSEQVRELHNAGMEIGGHTVNHPILASMDLASSETEIIRNRDRLQEITDNPVKLFAYPNGKPHTDYNADHVALVKKLGFDAAVSTGLGVSSQHSDCFQLPRFTPWDTSPTRFSLRLLNNLRKINDNPLAKM